MRLASHGRKMVSMSAAKAFISMGNMQTGAWKRIRRSVSQVKRKMSGGM